MVSGTAHMASVQRWRAGARLLHYSFICVSYDAAMHVGVRFMSHHVACGLARDPVKAAMHMGVHKLPSAALCALHAGPSCHHHHRGMPRPSLTPRDRLHATWSEATTRFASCSCSLREHRARGRTRVTFTRACIICLELGKGGLLVPVPHRVRVRGAGLVHAVAGATLCT